MRRFLKEPLVHFMVLGAIIFFAYSELAGPQAYERNAIVISLAQQENLANTFSRTWQRRPSAEELEGLVRDYIREEVAYREGLAMQLDANDVVIRRRLRQKLELFAEDLFSLTPPSEEALEAWYDERQEDFRTPAILSFRQVYVNFDEAAGSPIERANELLRQLISLGPSAPIDTLGDTSLLPESFVSISAPQVDQVFGSGFAERIIALPDGQWSGPVESGYGLHLVLVESRTAPRTLPFDEVRDEVHREWAAVYRRQAVDDFYERLAENYTIIIEAVEDDSQ